MDEENKELLWKRIPKLLDAREVLLAEHGLIGEVMDWAYNNDEEVKDAVNYIWGIYDLADKLLREIEG